MRNSNMEELSIDSKSNKKVPLLVAGDQKGPIDYRHSTAKNCDTRPHFRIDWRQLTYFQKQDNRTLLSEFFSFNNVSTKRQENEEGHHLDKHQQQQHHDWAQSDDGATISSSMLSGDEGHDDDELGATSDRYYASKGKQILNSLDGCFKSGQLNAILGPSGAGKSTFLSALFGNKQESSYGQTKVTWEQTNSSNTGSQNKSGQQRQTEKLEKRDKSTSASEKSRYIRIAFLPQHDHLLNHLTVYETLLFASKIKNPDETSDKAFHRANVRRVAKMLKLTDCLNTRCGRLSGGQHKRVSIGQELLSQPDVIILDEPTSGLDAMTCLTTIRTLKSIVTKHPICIILTIHQPDIDVFNLFDHVYVIAQGGMAIYEGPPQLVVPTLSKVNLFMPSDTYNPARFIVENAFVVDLDSSKGQGGDTDGADNAAGSDGSAMSSSSEDNDSGDDDHDEQLDIKPSQTVAVASQMLRRSISSLTSALGIVGGKSAELAPQVGGVGGAGLLGQKGSLFRDSGRRPLLNIGIQTADGKLITTSDVLQMRQQNAIDKEQAERRELLARLNRLQKARYYKSSSSSSVLSQGSGPPQVPSVLLSCSGNKSGPGGQSSSSYLFIDSGTRDSHGNELTVLRGHNSSSSHLSLSTSSISAYSQARDTIEPEPELDNEHDHDNDSDNDRHGLSPVASDLSISMPAANECCNKSQQQQQQQQRRRPLRPEAKLRRNFDKLLSAKHEQSKRRNYPVWYHSYLLTQRTWLSIVRDPVFFGIQFTMHTTIPILLAFIFGSHQNEGCPRVGNLDMVDFAYQPNQADFIMDTMQSIRKSLGNVGVMFFEMFVLCFAINCITALVFPSDMHVLLKEYRNGWYSLRSYFLGRTLADLPVPLVLHTMAMAVLYYLTGQPFVWWRFGAICGLVIIASLVAQSVGLTIGAILMRSPQSAVLAAAGIVAPFFALSGFIVRIHTLSWVARLFANCSYLYHILNGFIILRYGFGRCLCKEDDFEPNEAHKIPHNLRTMASMWVGTYSSEYEQAAHQLSTFTTNRTNIDPNIDIIDKLMGAFKLANSFGHNVQTCEDVLPYAMLDFNQRDEDLVKCVVSLLLMLLVTRSMTFIAIYFKIRSFA